MQAKNSSRLEGKKAVITGGGRGIGAATARLLAAEGAAVVVSARSQDQVEKIAEELRAQGARALGVPCDVADPEQVKALRAKAEEALGPVDILVNNAGIATSAPLHATSLEVWNRVLAVNATGTFLCSQTFLPPMIEAGWGRVVNVASVAGKAGAPYISAYCASKHAVVGFTRALAAEVAKSGVTVNAVCPGYVATDMAEQAVTTITKKTRLGDDEARRSLEAMSPQGRIFGSEEVAFQVLSLCDPRAKGINGQALVLDGGALQS